MKTLNELAKEIQFIAKEIKNIGPGKNGFTIDQCIFLNKKHSDIQKLLEKMQAIINRNNT